MKKDKGLLNYHGEAQIQFALKQLVPFCAKVFISCRKEQRDLPHYSGLPLIIDQYKDCGALAGILSAFEYQPDAAWLVLACDMPRVDSLVIRQLICHRNKTRHATAFRLDAQSFPEPLCALYEPSAYPMMRKAYASKAYALVKILQSLNPVLLQPTASQSLLNINTPDHYLEENLK